MYIDIHVFPEVTEVTGAAVEAILKVAFTQIRLAMLADRIAQA